MHLQRGFTYLGLLYAVALASTALLAAGGLWSTQARREKEEELLFVGSQIRAAIGAYWDKAPAGQPHALPRTLDDLLDDKRWPARRRHLRKVFRDPITGVPEWGLIQAPDGGVVGVYSRSDAAPLRRAGFAPEYADFADASSYRDWRFVFVPSAPVDRP